MTHEEMKQLTNLKGEILRLNKRIDEVQEKINKYQIHDSVKASLTEFPYTQHSVAVSGISGECYPEAWKLRKELDELKSELETKKIKNDLEYARLNRYIQKARDSVLRDALSMHYIDNLTWSQVAANIGNGYSEDAIKKMCYRYLKKN